MWNQSQKSFTKRLVIVIASLAAGLVLTMVADNGITGMDAEFWVSKTGGLFFAVSTVSAIVTLRYGHKHEAAIRERKSLSYLLTAYRILFWLWVVAALLAAAILVWVAFHLGPVR